MKVFESTVTKFTANIINIDDTCALLESWANHHKDKPDYYMQASAILEKLYNDHQIGESIHKKLLRSIQSLSTAEDSNPDSEMDEDETVVVNPMDIPEDQDTVLITDDESTVLLSDDEKTAILGADDFQEISSLHSDILQPGSILKERFNLVSILGEGGMGRVYKAIDMLKVEAKDSNPYVAIKVLSEDFKKHPDAFISLQRETSKAQKLAHPNISTVFDFDRHGETVYMTMELLEGEPLDEFIKKMPKDGLPKEEALPIVEGLGAGLSYAHEQGLVHSDFKPGNAFILNDGSVKVIDFGIARAAAAGTEAQTNDKNSKIKSAGSGSTAVPTPDYAKSDTSETSTTKKNIHYDDVFDAGSLGALTPSYATIEMYDGKDPAPSDDIYALACVTGQLLTGSHPYNKRPAPKAKEEKLKPPIIDGFTKRQQKAFEKALAYTRENRTETMNEFLDGIRYRKDYTKQIVLGTILSISLLGGLGYNPVTNYFEQKEIDEIIYRANNGTQEEMLLTLDSLKNYKPENQISIKAGIKDRALEVFTTKIANTVNLEKDDYEFKEAFDYINDALRHYPDSSAIKGLSQNISTAKTQFLEALHTEYLMHLKAGDLLAMADKEDMTDVLDKLKHVEPDDKIFNDPRLEIGYYNSSKNALTTNDLNTALLYLNTGKVYIQKSSLFQNLSDQATMKRISTNLVEKQKLIENDLSGIDKSLINFKPYVHDLTILGIHSNHNSKLYNEFIEYLDKEVEKLESSEPQIAYDLVLSYVAALPIDKLIDYSERLTSVSLSAETQPDMILPDLHFINDKTDLNTLSKHLSEIKLTVFKHQNNALTEYNINVEKEVTTLTKENRFSLISYYNELYKDLFLTETFTTINDYHIDAKKQFNNKLANIKSLANIENDKRIFRAIASENRLNDSIKTYNKIAKNSDDIEFLDFAKNEIARMYSTLAESNATENNFINALNYINEAKKYAFNDHISKQEYDYTKKITIVETADLIITRDEDNKSKATAKLKELKSKYADDYSFITDRISELINVNIIELSVSELINAHRLKAYSLTILNTEIIRNVGITPLPKPSKLAIQGKIEVSQYNLTAAKTILDDALLQQPKHYQVHELRDAYNKQLEIAANFYNSYLDYYGNEKYQNANEQLDQAIINWKDNDGYIREREYYKRVMSQFHAGGKLCRLDLQGIGKQTRGACNDMILSTETLAPTMVVVPAITRKSDPYAISKFELSTGELNSYCEATENCEYNTDTADELPVTNVDVETIEGYTLWLSNETGFKYQIASHKEWLNAASAGGREGNTNYNCRLRLGTKLIKGQNIVPISSGAANNWGLINYVGNADEIVANENGYVLVGGNFSDSISECKVSLVKPFNSASKTSGYRLVRYLN